MVTKVMAGLGALALACAGCSSDNGTPKTDTGVAVDQGMTHDSAAGDARKPDAGAGDAAKPDAKAPTTYTALLAASELSGRLTWGPTPSPAPTPTKILSLRLTFDPNDPSLKPDFQDAPSPPNCTVYKWTGTTPPNRTAGDAGKVSVKGHKEVNWVDGAAPTTSGKLPATIDCTRKQLGTSKFYTYDCGLPDSTVLPADSWLDDTSKLEFTVAGGTEVKAFSKKDLAAAAMAKPKASFDLNQLDPTAATVTAEWETLPTGGADLVAVDMYAYLKDKSEHTRITCVTLAVAGKKQIPADALKLLPKVTKDDNPLLIQTGLVALKVTSATESWGIWYTGVGRGSVGLTCRTTTGFCPVK
ncbi:MAG: hypothetical protein IT371_27120 [Deltaproteobacteria bacterium]|nr:hypothetical protein [Deltaproteobacteria bacterium]